MKSNQKSNLRGLLQVVWHEFANFIVEKSALDFQPTTAVENDKYAKKARFYVFLPAEEEQRDWLERTYCKSKSITL